MSLVAATSGSASAQRLPDAPAGAVLEPGFYLPIPTPADLFAAPVLVSNPLGFLLRPWASPQDVCQRAAGDLALAEEGASPEGEDVFCYWLVSPSPPSTTFFQATGSPTDTQYVRFKLTSTAETFEADAAAFRMLVGTFHSQWGWMVPSSLPNPASVNDASFETHGVQYHLWRETSETPRLNLTMVFPTVGLSSAAFSH